MILCDNLSVINRLDTCLHSKFVGGWFCSGVLNANLMVASVKSRKVESEIFFSIRCLQFFAFRIDNVVIKTFRVS